MFKKYCFTAFCLLLFACSKEEKVNTDPAEFELLDLSFDGTKASLTWSTATDADKDEVYYHVYLNSQLIEGPVTIQQIFTPVEYNKDYEGLIIATDKNGGFRELKFSFRSPASEILITTDWQNSNMLAIDLHTQRRLWEAPTAQSTTSVQNGLAFAGITELSAYNIMTGEKAWEVQPVKSRNTIAYRHLLADKRLLYARATEAGIICIDLERREKQWAVPLDGNHPFSMDRDNLYVPVTGSNDLVGIEKVSGKTRWGFNLNRPLTSLAPRIEHAPLVVEDNLYFQDNNGRFYSVNKHSGVKNYSISIGKDSKTAPVASNGNIIFTAGQQLISVRAATGEINWKRNLSAHSRSSPFIYSGNLYVGAGQQMFKFKAATGELQWISQLGGMIMSSPIVYDQKIYVSSYTARLHCIDTKSGNIEWEEGNTDFSISSPTLVIGDSERIIHSSDHGLHY